MAKDTIDHNRLDELVGRLNSMDNHYQAAIDICAELYDGRQDHQHLLLRVIKAIETRILVNSDNRY